MGKYIYLVRFEEDGDAELDCAFDTFAKAKKAVMRIFTKLSFECPNFQDLILVNEDTKNERAEFKFNAFGEDANKMINPYLYIYVERITYNCLPDYILKE